MSCNRFAKKVTLNDTKIRETMYENETDGMTKPAHETPGNRHA